VVIFVVKKLKAMNSEIGKVIEPLGGQLKAHYRYVSIETLITLTTETNKKVNKVTPSY
jgi:hypothetical protein